MSDYKRERISQLRNDIHFNNAEIDYLRNNLSKLQQEYNSLCQFRNTVVSTKESFYYVTKKQEQYLKPVKELGAESISGRNYAHGMSKTLSGFGSRVVGLALKGLLVKIDWTLKSCQSSINNVKNSIKQSQDQKNNRLNEIAKLERQISEENE